MTPPPELLFVSWQDEVSRKIVPIARLMRIGDAYEFVYVNSVNEARRLGFEPLAGFPDFGAVYRSNALPPLFENRMMPRSRVDFASHVAELALPLDQAEPFTVLARTGGKRATDRLELFSPPAVCSSGIEGVFLARGIRHIPGAEQAVGKLHEQERLRVLADLQNDAHKLALALRTDRCEMVGYVPDYLAVELGRVQATPADLTVHALKVNPDPAPVHNRLLCRFQYPLPLGRELFRGPLYDPVSKRVRGLHRARPKAVRVL